MLYIEDWSSQIYNSFYKYIKRESFLSCFFCVHLSRLSDKYFISSDKNELNKKAKEFLTQAMDLSENDLNNKSALKIKM